MGQGEPKDVVRGNYLNMVKDSLVKVDMHGAGKNP